mgnify:CR=1 FL=1
MNEGGKKEPCGGTAQGFIYQKTYRIGKNNKYKEMFELATQKPIRKRRKYPVSGKDNRGVYHATR